MSLYRYDEPTPRDVDMRRDDIDDEDADCLCVGDPEDLTDTQAAEIEEAFRALRSTWGT